MEVGVEIKIVIGPGMSPGQVGFAIAWLGEYFTSITDLTKLTVIALRGPNQELVGAATVYGKE